MPSEAFHIQPEPHISRMQRGPLRAFAHPRFSIFWFLSLLSIMAFFMSLIVRGWLILDLTDSPFMVMAVYSAQMVPMLMLPLLGGALADRGGRKKLLLATDAFSLLSLLAIAGLVFAGWVEVWHVFGLAVASGAAFSLGMPARSSVIPDLVGHQDIPSGVAIFSTIFSLGQIAGPAPAGFIINAYGMGWSFLAAAAMMAPPLVGMAFFRVPEQTWNHADNDGKARVSVLESIAEALRYVRSQQLMTGLLLLILVITTFIMPYQAIMPVYARDILKTGPESLGLLMTAAGLGALLGSFGVATAGGFRQLNPMMIVAGVGSSVSLILFAFSSLYTLSLFLSFALGLFIQMFMTSNFTMVQMVVPAEMRARVISIRFVAIGLGPIGMLSLGAAAEVFGPKGSLAVMGLLNVALVGLVLLFIPATRRPEAEATAMPEETTAV